MHQGGEEAISLSPMTPMAQFFYAWFQTFFLTEELFALILDFESISKFSKIVDNLR